MNDGNHDSPHEKSLKRRDFVKLGTLAGIGVAISSMNLAGCMERRLGPAPKTLFRTPPIERLRIGFVGVGHQGSSHVKNFLNIEGVEIKAICDIVQDKVTKMQDMVVQAGFSKPTGYSSGEYDYIRMCEEQDLDLVFTATPWNWHVPVCVAAMKNGMHAATEVPAAVTIDECWELVETAEKYQKHCVMMENCCYDREEMMILNMVRQELLGELIHAEAGYLHDLRLLKLDPKFYQGEWRVKHSFNRNGNLYPTHGLGPVAQCLNINRGNQFDFLVSMSSKSRGLNLFATEYLGPDHPRAKQHYALGDVNVSLIRTVNEETITLYHDCSSPRPYTRKILVQGTKGLAGRWPNRIHIEGRSPAHEWEALEDYFPEFEHPLWQSLQEISQGAGHGGMDYIEDYRLVQCLREGKPMDMDVYDAAAWSAVSELTEISVANRSKPVDFPDFTRGQWQNYPALGIVNI